MSEDSQKPQEPEAAVEQASPSAPKDSVELQGLMAFKLGMSSIYRDNGESVPVTVLRYEPCYVSQIKTEEKEGYSAVQIACSPSKASRSSKANTGHLNKTPFEHGAKFVREVKGQLPDGITLGQKVSIDSLKPGDEVDISSFSKGRGFSGVVKRWNFAGGPATHGSGFHRRPGSIGNRTWPGRVIAGKKMPGQFGNKKITVQKIEVVGVLPEESLLMLKGSVPGARNSLVQLMKVK